jgi:hypothetical protein
MTDKTTTFIPFNCPYCGVEVRMGDKHATLIEKKNIRDTPTIMVRCELNRTFEITPKVLVD